MIDVIVEIDPDISGIDEKKSINILQSTLKSKQFKGKIFSKGSSY